MFDIGWQELFILAVIALIVIGPKDLPSALRIITRGLRKARTMARDLRDGLDDVVREAELEDITNTIRGEGGDLTQQIKDAADLDFDDMALDGDLRDEMTSAVDDLKSLTDPGASGKEAEAEKANTPKKRKSSKKLTAKSSKKLTAKSGKKITAKSGKADG